MSHDAPGISSLPQQDIYGQQRRDDVRPFIPSDCRAVLDVGCAQGGFGPTLRAVLGPDVRIVGVEAVASQAEIAASGQGYDDVVTGFFPQALEGSQERFDLICFNDVLEHVLDPWETVRSVHRFLQPGGRVLAAIPNVQVIDNLVALMRGAWDYADSGILDRTHVRFFTRRTMIELFENNGYVVESCVGANPASTSGRWRAHLLRGALKRAIPDSRYLHFVLVARSTQV